MLQASNANYLQKALANQASNFQVIEKDAGQVRVENIVQLGPLLSIKAGGSCKAEGASRTLVSLDDIRAELGPLRCATPLVGLDCDQQWRLQKLSARESLSYAQSI